MSDASLDDIPPINSKSFIVCPQLMGDIIGSDDEDWSPPKNSYSVITQLNSDHTPSQFNKNVVAINSDFKKVFVKELKTEALQDPIWIQQVEKQFQIHYKLIHPNVVRVMNQDFEEKKIILEFMNEAQYFEKVIIEQAKPIENIIKLKSYIHDIAEGLKYIHSQNFVHADIRLETLQCTKGKQDMIRTVKIGDFGNIQRKGDIFTQFHIDFIKKRQIVVPPELAVGLMADESFDIWCFGIVIHQMAVAYAPNCLPQNLQIVDKVAFLKNHWIQHDSDLFKLVKSMLSVNPKERPSAEQIAQNNWFQ